MKRYRLYIYSLILLLGIGVSSCKKENTTYPRVSIKAPADGSSYSFGDTLRVAFKVTQRSGPVNVDLQQGATLISLPNRLVYEDANIIEYELYFTDRYLLTGNYQLRVQAFNGENSTAAFVEIFYTELPLHFRGMAILSKGVGGNSYLSRYDSIGNIESQNLNGEYFFLAANSFQQRLAVAPMINGTLQGFRYPDLVKTYEISNPANPGLRQYEYLFSSGEYIYAFENGGQIRGFRANGETARSYSAPANYIPQIACTGEQGMLLSAKLEGKNEYRLFLMNPQNGAVLKQVASPGRVSAMAYAGEGIYAVVSEKNGDAAISVYDYGSNTLTPYAQLPGEAALSLLAVSDHYFLLSTDSRILRFDPHLTHIPGVVQNFAATDMEINRTTGEVYYASGYQVLSGAPGAGPVPVFTATDSIRQIEIVYNK